MYDSGNIPVGTILTIIFGVITFLALGIGIMFGFKRNAATTVVRLVFLALAIVIAALAATVIAVDILDKNAGQICDAFAGLYGDSGFIESIRDYLTSGSEAVRDMQKLLIALVAPVIFAVVFFLSDIILLIIYAVITPCTCSEGHKRRVEKKKQRGGESREYKKCSWKLRTILVILNVAMSFVIAICLILPVTYYLGLVTDVAESAGELIETLNVQTTESSEEREGPKPISMLTSSGIESEEELEAILGLFAEIKSNPLMELYGTASNFVAAPLTTVHGQTIHDMVMSALPAAIDIMTEAEELDLQSLASDNLTEETIDGVAEFVNHASVRLKEITILDHIIGELLCDAAGNWANEQPFLTLDIYELVGDKNAESPEGEAIDLKSVVKVLCEVFADKEKPLASDKLELVVGIIGPAGGIMPAINALSNVGGAEDLKNIDKQVLYKILDVSDEYKQNAYADEKFGRIIFAVLDSSTLGLSEEYSPLLKAVIDCFGEDERSASGLLGLLGDTLIVTVDVANEVDTSVDDVESLADSIGNASAILEGSPRVDQLFANVLFSSYHILPMPEDYGDAVDTFMEAVKEEQQLYTTGSSVLKLLGKSLEIVGDFTDADTENLNSDAFYEIRDTLSESGNEELNRITARMLDAGVTSWLNGSTYCGIEDPLNTYSEIKETLYQAVLDHSLATASEKIGFIGDMFRTMNDITEIDYNNVTSTAFYDLAKEIAVDVLADKTSGQIISDAAEAWSKGNQFCDKSDPVVGSKFSDGIYTAFINQPGEKVLASDKLIAAGNVVDLSNIVIGAGILSNDAENSQTQDTEDQVRSLVENLNDQSASIVKETMSDSFISSLIDGETSNVKNDEQSAAAVSAAVGELVDGLLELKTDESKTAEEVEKEQQAVADLFDAVNNADAIDEQKANELVESIKDSKIIQNTVSCLIVEDEEGNKSCAIEAEADEETQQCIVNALNDSDIDEEYKENILLIFVITNA